MGIDRAADTDNIERKKKQMKRFMVVAGIILTSCGVAEEEFETVVAQLSRNLSGRVLTPDGNDVYTIEKFEKIINMSAPVTNTNTNLREIFWPIDESYNAQVCATWDNQSADTVQQGVALQIVDSPKRTRAITVTKNIWAHYFLVFNVHMWDTDWAQPFVGIGQYNMSAVLDSPTGIKPLPWRICARMDGTILMFKVWLPGTEREPSWTDAIHTNSMLIPKDFAVPGRVGWYVGHIPPGGSARYSDLVIR